MRMRLLTPATLLLAFALVVAGCDSGSDGPTGPSGTNDTTAPQVLSIDPGNDDTGVGVDDDVVVVFTEDMDPTTAAGAITLSSGTVTDLAWIDARTLRVQHDDWAQGTRIDVTIGTGLTDVAGNALAAPVTVSFWTASPQLVLLSTTPADGATGVLRNTTVSLLFSQRMDLTSLANATVVDDGAIARALVPFTLADGENDRVLMSFDAELPATTTITVTIATSARSESGASLAQETSFSFTTGESVDDVPPTLLSIQPANGSVVSAQTNAIVITFSEAIESDSFFASHLGAQFWLLVEAAGIEPIWSAGGSVLTLPLPTPLPAGLPIVATFDEFADLAGNVQTQDFEYRIDVSGAADPWPFVDGLTYRLIGEDTDGIEPPFSYQYWQRMEEQPGGEFHVVSYGTSPELPGAEIYSWDVMRHTATRVQLLGFHEIDQGIGFDVTFSPPADYLRLPLAVGSWSDTISATTPDGTMTVDYTIESLGAEDLPASLGLVFEPPVFRGAAIEETQYVWIDAWATVLSYEMRVSGELVSSGVDSLWFAPAVGRVRSVSSETDAQTGTTRVGEEFVTEVDFGN